MRVTERLHLGEGWLCLEFANTVEWRGRDRPEDRLNDFTNLVAWARKVGLLTEAEARELDGEAARRPEEAYRAHGGAVELREAIYRIFSAVASQDAPPAEDLECLNAVLSQALAHLQVARAAGGFAWEWSGGNALDRLLWPIARSAAELLTSEELERVGVCADDRCGWLFFDTSKNHSRRWCSMDSCGNRAKVRRYYKRRRASRERSPS